MASIKKIGRHYYEVERPMKIYDIDGQLVTDLRTDDRLDFLLLLRTIDTVEEHSDFPPGWYWRTRHTTDIVGPFESAEAAAADRGREIGEYREY